MTVQISAAAAAADAVRCMGLGLFAACVRCCLPYGRRPRFWTDFLCAGLLLILLQAFAASRGTAGGMRWYLLLGGIAGAFAGEAVLLPVRRILTEPFHRAAAGIGHVAVHLAQKVSEAAKKRKKKPQTHRHGKKGGKNPQKQLQSEAPLLYNSNV